MEATGKLRWGGEQRSERGGVREGKVVSKRAGGEGVVMRGALFEKKAGAKQSLDLKGGASSWRFGIDCSPTMDE